MITGLEVPDDVVDFDLQTLNMKTIQQQIAEISTIAPTEIDATMTARENHNNCVLIMNVKT